MISAIFFLVLFLVFAGFGMSACSSYNKMLFLEQELIMANKEIPNWITFRKKFIKDRYEKFKAHPVRAYLVCALFTILIFLIGISI